MQYHRIISPSCCLRRLTRVPSSMLSRSPTGASPSARHRAAHVALPSTNAGTGKDDGGLSIITIISPSCCLCRLTRVPSSMLSRSPTGASPSARHSLRYHPPTRVPGRMTVGYRHHFALAPPSSTDAVFIIHAVSFTNRGTAPRPRAALVALPSTNAKGKKRMTVGVD
jgi:hypothetical protein